MSVSSNAPRFGRKGLCFLVAGAVPLFLLVSTPAAVIAQRADDLTLGPRILRTESLADRIGFRPEIARTSGPELQRDSVLTLGLAGARAQHDVDEQRRRLRRPDPRRCGEEITTVALLAGAAVAVAGSLFSVLAFSDDGGDGRGFFKRGAVIAGAVVAVVGIGAGAVICR